MNTRFTRRRPQRSPNKMTQVEIEQLILEKAFEKIWEELSDEEKEDLLQVVGVRGDVTYSAFSAALHTFIRSRGFMPYKLTLIVINAISKKILGRGLSLTANATAMKFLAGTLARSVNVLLWGWFVNDIVFSPVIQLRRIGLCCVVLCDPGRIGLYGPILRRIGPK